MISTKFYVYLGNLPIGWPELGQDRFIRLIYIPGSIPEPWLKYVMHVFNRGENSVSSALSKVMLFYATIAKTIHSIHQKTPVGKISVHVNDFKYLMKIRTR